MSSVSHKKIKTTLKTIDLNLFLQNCTDALHLWLSPKITTGKRVLVRKQESLGSQRTYTSSALVSHEALSQALISDRFQPFNSISPRKLWCGLVFFFLFVLCVGFFCLVCFFCCCWFGVWGFFRQIQFLWSFLIQHDYSFLFW